MRIISGDLRGRKLNPVNLKFTRPTTDYAREGLFNLLASRLDFEGLDVLDLYSGSGAISFEFISRGVESATAVDIQLASVKFISETKLKWEIDNLEVIKYDVIRYLSKCQHTFDIIFADPPYDSQDYKDIIEKVFTGKLLKEGGYLILEHEKNHDFSNVSEFEFQRSFGKVNFSLFQP